jgi:hypothetical protein
MDKFSLYDLLGMVLPGFIVMYLGNLICNEYGLIITMPGNTEWLVDFSLSLSLAILIGAILFASSFYLVQKKWFKNITGLYENTYAIHKKSKVASLMNAQLNKVSQSWFSKDIFFGESETEEVNDEEKMNNLREHFYDRMYYELDYLKKVEGVITAQSFYFFFRQTALGCIILLIVALPMPLLHTFFLVGKGNLVKEVAIVLILSSFVVLSIKLAIWFRKRMVTKIFWTYYTHINLNK